MKIYLSIIAILLSFSFTADAAQVSIVAPDTVVEGKSFSVLVELDTEGTLINSFDITVSYPTDVTSFSGYKEDGSIKKVWLAPPTDKNGTIHFSGIIPGGVNGVYDPDKKALQPLPIIQLLFYAKSEGQGDFDISDSLILKNDGRGTPLLHTKDNATVSVSKSPSPIDDTTNEDIKNTDRIPPLPFNISFIEAGFFSRTPSMIMFSTTDSESGVQMYQMRTAGNNWKDVISPMPVTKGLIKRDITVRSVDFGGNAREAQVEIPGILSSMQLLGIVFIGAVCYFIFFVLKRKR
jgi:hypothetical protein